MGARLVTAPTLEPVSLADAKLHCRVVASDEDSIIGTYIAAARQFVEEHCARKLINQTWDVTLDSFTPAAWPTSYGSSNSPQYSYATNWIELPFGPASSITSLTYTDATGATITLSNSAYSLDTSSAIPRVLALAAWPATRVGQNVVTVRAVFGYGALATDVPAAIRAAILLLVGNYFANREAVVDSRAAIELPLGVMALLAPYRAALGV